MGIEKVRIYECDSRCCTTTVVGVLNRMPTHWAWRAVVYRKGKKVKVAETHSYSMFLFCPACMAREDVDVPGFA